MRYSGSSKLQRRTVAWTVRPRRATRRPPVARRSFSSHRMAQSLRGARPDVLAVRQTIHVTRQGQGRKGAKAKGGGANSGQVVIFVVQALLVLATMLGSSRSIKVGGPFFCIDVLFFQRNRVHEICQRRDRHSSFPSPPSSMLGPSVSDHHLWVKSSLC